jgi:hypothetical protein
VEFSCVNRTHQGSIGATIEDAHAFNRSRFHHEALTMDGTKKRALRPVFC